jgi:serine/threonine protein phosphatase PrpC
MSLDISYYSSTGERDINEDFVSVKKSGSSVIAIVADGLGGHEDGELASGLAVETILCELNNKEISSEELRKAVLLANDRIIESVESDTMKSTVAVSWMDEKQAVFSNVGDTRIYLFRDKKVLYQSTDHSVSQMAVMAGEITTSEIRGHKDRNKLVRVLGSKNNIKVDIKSADLSHGDAILICSDGFWENITEEEMCSLLMSSENASQWIAKMRQTFETECDDKDNNSAIAVIV